MTLRVIVLAHIASGFTATASVAQRRAAAPAPEKLSLSWRLLGYLLRRPIWFLGILSMILGFIFQVEALRVGSLSLVQPLIATELVMVFGVIALQDRQRVHGRDWLSAFGMVIGLGGFLALARPCGGHTHSSASMWLLAGLSTFAVAGLLTALAYVPGRGGQRPSAGRKAAFLGVAAATGFGFVAAVTKELSAHLGQGPPGVFLNWSPYVLLLSGAGAMLLASNAFQAGSLAASQPGLTIVDPIVASMLGVVLFGERLNHHPVALAGGARRCRHIDRQCGRLEPEPSCPRVGQRHHHRWRDARPREGNNNADVLSSRRCLLVQGRRPDLNDGRTEVVDGGEPSLKRAHDRSSRASG